MHPNTPKPQPVLDAFRAAASDQFSQQTMATLSSALCTQADGRAQVATKCASGAFARGVVAGAGLP